MSKSPSVDDATNALSQKLPAQSWAVVGGGMLGLSTAWKLLKAGHDVTVLEAAPELGGLTSAWRLGDAEWDKFYHVILLSDTRLRSLLAEIGLEKEMRWVTTKTGFYSNGKLHSLSSSLDFLLFPPLSLLQKFRLGGTIFLASKIRSSAKLEKVPVSKWLTKLSGKKVFEKIWLPLLKAKLGEAYQRTSAAFIWSYIDRMYKARRSGMKREMFGYVPGGYRRILNVFREQFEAAGGKVLLSYQVTKVERDSDNTKVLVYSDSTQDQPDTFDRVIMTTPSPIISKAIPTLTTDEHERLNEAEYIGVVCTSLLLDRELAGYYVTNLTDSSIPLTGIIEMGAIVKPEYMNGKYLVYLPQYLLSSDKRFEESEESIHERCLSTLEKIYPDFTRDRVHAIQTAKARFVMTLPTLNYSQRLPPVVSSVPGVYLLNSAQVTVGNLNVNETIEIVERELARSIYPDVLTSVGQSGPSNSASPTPAIAKC